jgi:hypothetical protein
MGARPVVVLCELEDLDARTGDLQLAPPPVA